MKIILATQTPSSKAFSRIKVGCAFMYEGTLCMRVSPANAKSANMVKLNTGTLMHLPSSARVIEVEAETTVKRYVV